MPPQTRSVSTALREKLAQNDEDIVQNSSPLKRAAFDDITPTSAKRSKVKDKTLANHVVAKTPSKTFSFSQIVQKTPSANRGFGDFLSPEALEDVDDEMDKTTLW